LCHERRRTPGEETSPAPSWLLRRGRIPHTGDAGQRLGCVLRTVHRSLQAGLWVGSHHAGARETRGNVGILGSDTVCSGLTRGTEECKVRPWDRTRDVLVRAVPKKGTIRHGYTSPNCASTTRRSWVCLVQRYGRCVGSVTQPTRRTVQSTVTRLYCPVAT